MGLTHPVWGCSSSSQGSTSSGAQSGRGWVGNLQCNPECPALMLGSAELVSGAAISPGTWAALLHSTVPLCSFLSRGRDMFACCQIPVPFPPHRLEPAGDTSASPKQGAAETKPKGKEQQVPRGDRPGARASTEVPDCIPMPHLLPCPQDGALHSQCCRMGSSRAGEKAWWQADRRQEAAGRLWHWQWQAHRQGWAPVWQIDRCLVENILLIGREQNANREK